MSEGDVMVLEQLLNQKRAELAPHLSEAEYFELFSAEKILRDFDLDDDELGSGLVGGSLDGGIDSIYFFAGGILVQDDTDLTFLKKNVALELVIIQSKVTTGFSEATLDKFIIVTEDLLNPSKQLDLAVLASTFNPRLLHAVDLFRQRYKSLIAKFPMACTPKTPPK